MEGNQHEQIKVIIQSLRKVYKQFRDNNPWTKHQDAIGLIILLLTLGFIGFSIGCWHYGLLPTWGMVITLAFLTSILHELEHDLIHELYFKKSPVIYHLMMLGIYIPRPICLNPWFRKYWHHFHHQHSGMPFDVEERGITNGDKLNLFRLLLLPDLLLLGAIRFPWLKKEIKAEKEKGTLSEKDLKMINKTLRFGLLPLGIPLTLMWYAYALGNIMHWCGFEIRSLLTYSDAVHWIMMIFVLPNLIRQFALHFISSNMHYFGDIEHGNIVQQVQIFKPWWSYPFQLFCFFFGVTHAIHHFWVN